MAPKCHAVAVVGGGVSGLASVKTCIEDGMKVTGFESKHRLGGVWSDCHDAWNPNSPRMYPSLVTNTSKATTCLSDFPCPASYPPYLPHWQFRQYVESYAQHFNLKEHFQFNTRVLSVMKTRDHDITGRWVLTLIKSDQSSWEEEFDGVIVCTGFFSKAWIPEVSGLRDKFKGRVFHSKDYTDSSQFAGRTVLVVGNASSAGDIACDISNVATQVYMSIGSGTTLLTRGTPTCLPPDLALKRVYSEWLSPQTMHTMLQDRAHRQIDHVRSGLLYTGSRKVDSPVLICDDLPVRLLSGKVKIIPYVTEYRQNEAVTSTGHVITDVDDVIFATGYGRDFSVIDPSLGCGGDKLFLYKQVFPIEEVHQTIALVGCQRIQGPVVPVLELQARLAAHTLSGCHLLPPYDVMKREVDQVNSKMLMPNGTYKYAYLFPFLADSVAEELGVKPKFWKLVLSGKPSLAFKCFFGPFLPSHFRLCGIGSWPGAEDAINRSVSECLLPLQSRHVAAVKSGNRFKRFGPWRFIIIALLAVFVSFLGHQKSKDIFHNCLGQILFYFK